jgi:GntR family transcriptional regulator
LKKASPVTDTTYSLFEGAGINPDEARHIIKAKEADGETAQWLNILPGTPILCLERTTYLSNGAPLEHVVFHYRADRFEFKLKMPRINSTAENQYDVLAGGIANVLNHNFQSKDNH